VVVRLLSFFVARGTPNGPPLMGDLPFLDNLKLQWNLSDTSSECGDFKFPVARPSHPLRIGHIWSCLKGSTQVLNNSEVLFTPIDSKLCLSVIPSSYPCLPLIIITREWTFGTAPQFIGLGSYRLIQQTFARKYTGNI